MSTLSVLKEPSGNIVIKLAGDLTTPYVQALKADIAYAEKVIQDAWQESGVRVRVLLDMTAFTGAYDVGAVEAMTGFAEHNANYIFKTAAFGTPAAAALAAESVAALASRENIQFFPNETKAREWLAF